MKFDCKSVNQKYKEKNIKILKTRRGILFKIPHQHQMENIYSK